MPQEESGTLSSKERPALGGVNNTYVLHTTLIPLWLEKVLRAGSPATPAGLIVTIHHHVARTFPITLFSCRPCTKAVDIFFQIHMQRTTPSGTQSGDHDLGGGWPSVTSSGDSAHLHGYGPRCITVSGPIEGSMSGWESQWWGRTGSGTGRG